MTSEEEKRLLLLASIIRLGGSGTKKKVLDEIDEAQLMKFSEQDLKSRKSRNELVWRNDLAYIRAHLVRDGYVANETNNWGITELGRKYFSQLASNAGAGINFSHLKAEAVNGIRALAIDVELSDEAAIEGETLAFEGGVTKKWSTVYERDRSLRAAAIKFHGLSCFVCAFDFEARYGAIGAGFIEVHHLKPISLFGGESGVNPSTDLVVLCSNCHSMVHRRKGEPFSVEELRGWLNQGQVAAS